MITIHGAYWAGVIITLFLESQIYLVYRLLTQYRIVKKEVIK